MGSILPQAQREDISIAVERSLKSWHNHLQNVWERINEGQGRCLTAFLTLQEADEETIVQQTGLTSKTVHVAIETLLDRDLVICNETQHYVYCI
jgi:transcription initiation factor IIE alpha subunit